MAKISSCQIVDLAEAERIEAEIRELTNIRNNLPREHWGYLESKLADKRAELKEVEERATRTRQEGKLAALKAILVADYITDVAEDFADASRRMTHNGEAGTMFRDMVKACSDRHKICMREWGEIVGCIDKSRGWFVGREYSDIYDLFKEKIDPIVDDFLAEVRETKFWKKM